MQYRGQAPHPVGNGAGYRPCREQDKKAVVRYLERLFVSYVYTSTAPARDAPSIPSSARRSVPGARRDMVVGVVIVTALIVQGHTVRVVLRAVHARPAPELCHLWARAGTTHEVSVATNRRERR